MAAEWYEDLQVAVAVLSDIGCHRDINEDTVRSIQPGDPGVLAARGVLVLVADGMGGHSGGEIASRMAADVIEESYYSQPGPAAVALGEAFREANRVIHEAALQDRRLAGMGTTCTALVVRQGVAECAHVGDTRLYLVRDGKISLMTEDHSAVRLMVARGVITPAEARHHADRNVILRALGTHPAVEVSAWEEGFPVRTGDRFVLCSDGLHDLVDDDEIRAAVVDGPRRACEELVNLAKSRGGDDNITVALIDIRAPGEARDTDAHRPRAIEVPA